MRNTPNKPPAFGLLSLACHNEKWAEGISNAGTQDTGASPPPAPEIPALAVPASAALTAALNAAPKTPAA